MPQDILLLHAHGPGHLPQQHIVLLSVTAFPVEWKHVRLGIELPAFPRIPVHVDGHAGNHHQILLDIDQPCLAPGFPPHHHAPCHGQRTVQPGGQNHAAVFLRIQLQICPFHRHLRRLLYLECRGIGMGCRDMEAFRRISLWDAERDQRGIVPGHVIAMSGFQLPLIRLLQFPEAQIRKLLFQIRHRMVGGGALLNEFQHLFRASLIFLHIHGSPPRLTQIVCTRWPPPFPPPCRHRRTCPRWPAQSRWQSPSPGK